jgi:hypothetical protein
MMCEDSFVLVHAREGMSWLASFKASNDPFNVQLPFRVEDMYTLKPRTARLTQLA